MPADVVERMHTAILRAGDDDALAEELAHDELAGYLHLLGPPRAYPHAPEERIHLALKVLRRRVERRGQGSRALWHQLARFDDDVGFPHDEDDDTTSA